MKTNIRIAVVEDAAKVRRQIVETLNAHPGWRVVVECANAEAALREIPLARPDLVLLDIMLHQSSGLDLIAPLKAQLPQIPIVMLTVVDDPEKILRAIRSGASAYIIKQDESDLTASVEVVLAGGAPVMSPAVARRLWEATKASPAEPTREKFQLTPRQWEVLCLAARGRQKGDIAAELGISLDTVRNHFRNIYEKLGAHSVVEAVMKIQGTPGLLG